MAVEVLARGDLAADVASKIDVYLRGGSRLAIAVDPRKRTLVPYDADAVTKFGSGEVFARALDLPRS